MTGGGRGNRNQKGYSLIEMMVSVAVFSLLMSFGSQFLIGQRRSAADQEGIIETQQQIRAALGLMSREILLAGSGVSGREAAILVMDRDRIDFRANLTGGIARLQSEALAGQNLLPVVYLSRSDAFRKGKTVRICYAGDCEWHTLTRDGTASLLPIAPPLGRSFPEGSDLQPINRVRYDLRPLGTRNRFTLMRNVDGGSNAVAEGIESLGIDYWNRDQTPAALPEEIDRIQIRLSGTVPGNPAKRRTAVSQVAVRNRG